MKLKTLRLVNFGGYTDTTFNFVKDLVLQLEAEIGYELTATTYKNIKPLALIYGPNGIGKSTIIEAIKIISNPLIFKDREQSPDVYLRQLIRDDDYNPIADGIMEKTKNKMRVEGLFVSGRNEYRVVLTNDGFIVNELPEEHGGHAFFVDADNPINWNKFQLIEDHAGKFIELAETIYGFHCDLDGEVTDTITNEANGETITKKYYQDVIIEKGGQAPSPLEACFTAPEVAGQGKKDTTEGKTKVHFARMSAGEKKLATMIRQLCNPDNVETRDIILIDNIEMHVYFTRHAKVLDKLREFFPGKQIIATTHSSAMIEHVEEQYRYNIEDYRPEYKMLSNNEELKKDVEKASCKVTAEDLRKATKTEVKFEPHTLEDGTVIYGPSHLSDIVDDRCTGKSGRFIDHLIAKSIRIGHPDNDNYVHDPITHQFHASTPPAILEAARKKREAEELRKQKANTLWRRFCRAFKAAKNSFSSKGDE